MEKILSKKLTLVLAVLLAVLGLSTAAQTVSTRPYSKTEWINGVPYQVFNQPNDNGKVKHFIRADKQQTPQPKKRLAKEEAQMVNVNIQVVEDEDIHEYSIRAFKEEDMKDTQTPEKSITIGENTLEAGVYTFVAHFEKLNDRNEYVEYYVFKESIPVSEDMTLTFDADEAKNFVQTKIIDNDGNEIKQWHEIQDETGDSEWIDGEDIVLRGFLHFIKEGLGYDFNGWFSANIYHRYNFYVSDLDNISIACSLCFDKDDVIHTVSFYQKGVHEDVVFENDPNDYVEHEIEFKATPLSTESNSPHYPIVSNDFHGFAINTTILRNVSDSKIKYRFGKSNINPQLPIRFNSGLTDYCVINEWTDDEDYFSTFSLPIFNFDGELWVVNSGFTSSYVTRYNLYDIDGSTYILDSFQYPGHAAFSYPITQESLGSLGNNCPIMRTSPYVYLDDEVAMIEGYTESLGRFGECRESDKEVITSIVKLDGNVSEMGANFMAFSPDPNSGIIEATLTNENVDVDGIPGKNVSQIYIDMSREDKAPPTLTMLHFRDNEGLVTDRFTTSNVGNIELSAEDIYSYSNWEENKLHYSINPSIDVEVAYSPYGEDNWNELSVEEDPSLFFLPEMGNFFRGSLEGVTGQAYEGWFDLKVKVTDAAGNWQEQVISPAFRIDNLAYTSVANVGKDNAREVARYNLAGQRVGSDAKGVVIVKMSDGTARKVIL